MTATRIAILTGPVNLRAISSPSFILISSL
jgi:hypothetical protein